MSCCPARPARQEFESESEWFTVDIDNTSPGGAASGGKLVPGSHKTCEWRTQTMENTCIYNLYKRSPEASLLF